LLAPYIVPPRTCVWRYGPRPGPIAAPEEMLIIEPVFFSIMSGSTFCDIMKGACTLTAKARIQRLTA
jgi:hypothetical protein